MRINVYAEELTTEAEAVTKTLDDGRTFYAVRLFLKSSPALHHRDDDDDRTAITFWVPWTREGGNDFAALGQVFDALIAKHRAMFAAFG